MKMENFWDYSVWGSLNLIAILLLSLLLANTLKRKIKLLRVSLIPTSVLGGAILLTISGFYKLFTGRCFDYQKVWWNRTGACHYKRFSRNDGWKHSRRR